MINPFSLEGKTVFITGASSGIGRSVAVECSKVGALVIISGRNKDRLDETFNQLSGTGHQIIVADLSSKEELQKVSEALPILDGAVFAAGIPDVSLIKRFKLEKIEEVFSVNTYAPMMLTSQLLKTKKILRNSSLVYIESITGIFVGSAGDVIYNASKGGLNGFVKGASVELAPQGIRINAINPGLIPTAILNESNQLFGDEHHIDIMKSQYPLGRLGKPEDIAYGAIYLLSDASSWVTGTNLVIDGGYTSK